MTNQSISGIFRCGEENLFISFIYAKCNSIGRRDLWQSLELVDPKDDPWLVVGDFNVIREDSERVGGHPQPIRAMEEFNNCIDHYGLLDMQVTGRRLSWCNGHEGHTRSWARLDRAPINIHYANRFPSACFEYLNRRTSDHCPMLIHVQKQEVDLTPLIQKSVSEENNLVLVLAPTETEVLAAMKSIPKESSPGQGWFWFLSI
ncbi:hypothetical protein Patl1_12280 [Pistacia atlantica]|uniref:Uncharacterized protein n=1 Tax=Pistacia atlantica TaxID=434234 RepID=A0ACC1A1D9_9ROSI|nr:hypothetical protein Patl1_12280 [Pistacia atlantica]